jgi:organic radical activating enzyme
MANDLTEYLSCRHIERSLAFFPGNVRPCCANPVGGGSPVLAEFKGGRISFEAIREGRKRIKDSHRAGNIIKECLDCPYLRQEAWDSVEAKADMPAGVEVDEVSLLHFTTCNIRCNYCYTVTQDAAFNAPLSKVPTIYDTFEDMLQSGKLMRGATIRYAGGEPSLLPEFGKLLTLLSEWNCKQQIITNGVKRSQALIDAVLRGNTRVVIGIDAASPAVYKAIKKMDYNEVVWANAAELAAAGERAPTSAVWGKFIILEENYHETTAFAERAEAAGLKHIYFDVDATRVPSRGGAGMAEEITPKVALLQYECLRRGMEFDLMGCGQAWLTPERTAMIAAEYQKLEDTRGKIRPSQFNLGLLLQNRQWFGVPVDDPAEDASMQIEFDVQPRLEGRELVTPPS